MHGELLTGIVVPFLLNRQFNKIAGWIKYSLSAQLKPVLSGVLANDSAIIRLFCFSCA
jgi:hypothetical protein